MTEKACIAEFMLLIEEGILVRNHANDIDFGQFMRDSVRLATVIKEAETLLGRTA